MAVQAVVSKKIDNGNVVVDVKSRRIPTIQYEVPEQRADEFCHKYIEKDKKDNIISNVTFFGSVIAACMLITPLLKKVENGAGRMTLAIVAGILASVGSNYAVSSALAPNHRKFLESFNAKIYKEKPKTTVADIISK